MAHKVELRDEALADLAALYDYIARESSPEIAIGYVRAYERLVSSWRRFPSAGDAAMTSCQACASSDSSAG